MNFDPAEWGPPIAVLAFGIVAGLAAVVRLNRQDQVVEAQGREQDLIQAHEAAVEALKSLDLDQGKLDPADYQREREALIARGAAALRELEAFRAGQASTQAPAETPASTSPPAPAAPQGQAAPASKPLLSPEWRGALTALAVVALVGLLLQFAQSESVTRREGASMTGNQDLGSGATMEMSAPGQDPWVQARANLEQRLQSEPDNIDLLNELTQLTLTGGDAGAAMQYNQRVFELDPVNPDARVYKAVLAATVGMNDRAIEGLREVTVDHPDHARAWTYLGLVLLEMRDGPGAAAALEKAVALQPGIPPLEQALQRARSMSSAEVVVAGVANLAPDKASALTGREILYVSVRDPAGGPPLAALRLPPGPFPVSFQVTTADALAMGGAPRPFPANLDVQVRIDADGDPMTREDEPTASLSGVAKGSTGLQVELQ